MGKQEDAKPGAPALITRRALMEGVAGAAALLALGGEGAAYAGEPQLRPPGGQSDDTFYGACIRCGACRSACPTKAVGVGHLRDGMVNAMTPVMDFHSGYCDMCDGGFRCIAACPTGALTAFDPFRNKIGIAVIDEKECQLYGVSAACNAPCVDACAYDALSIDENGRLVVAEDRCNGCGACEYVCPTSAYRNYDGRGKRGINVEARG